MSLPSYKIDNREFKTNRGLQKYLLRKHGASTLGMVAFDRTLRVYRGTSVTAIYNVSAPAIGEPQTLTIT